MWLLLIEDERRLADSLRRGLEEEGYTVDVAHEGAEGYAQALANDYDVLVVDWRLPRKDGRTVVTELRAAGRDMPVLMLTALGDIEHRVQGLDAGADDYLTKPFAFEELLARLRACTRRVRPMATDPWVQVGPLCLDAGRREVTIQGHRCWLRPKEYAVLEVLMRQPGQAVSRTRLAERAWGDAFNVRDNVIDVTISGLRQKLAHGLTQVGLEEDAIAIQTLWGVGYRLTTEPEARP